MTIHVQPSGKVNPAIVKTAYDYAREVQRLIERVRRNPGSYEAALHGADAYPVFQVETPVGPVSLRLLSGTEAVTESDAMIVYGVGYRVFAHLKYEDGTWRRYDGVTGFDRLDGKRDFDIGPARKRFDAVVLPVLAEFLDDPAIQHARLAAQALRLTWNRDASHAPNLERLEKLISELEEARAYVLDTIAAANAEIEHIDATLAAKTAVACRIVAWAPERSTSCCLVYP